MEYRLAPHPGLAGKRGVSWADGLKAYCGLPLCSEIRGRGVDSGLFWGRGSPGLTEE